MTKDTLFKLYKRVQQKDRNAEYELIAEHKKMYPRSNFHKGDGTKYSTDPYYRETLHIMYLNLYR